MLESGYQSKIIKGIIADGGTAITGKLKTGEADIQAGYPMAILREYQGKRVLVPTLLNLMIEVKTPKDYERVMKCITEVKGLYVISEGCKGLKDHEPLQIHKINNVRKRGGMALVAHSYEQVEEYINDFKPRTLWD